MTSLRRQCVAFWNFGPAAHRPPSRRLDALLARAGADDRVRGAFRYHGASTGRWAGEGFQPQNLKRPVEKDLDAAIRRGFDRRLSAHEEAVPEAAVRRRRLQPAMITAADGHELDRRRSQLDRKPRAGMGCRRRMETRRLSPEYRSQPTIRAIEPYCVDCLQDLRRAGRHLHERQSRNALSAKPATSRLAIRAAWALGVISSLTGSVTTRSTTFKNEWRATHPKIVQFWYDIDRAAVKAVHEPGVEFAAVRSIFKSDGTFLQIELPSGRKLSYPNPRLIVDDRDRARVVYDDNSGGRFAPCRGGYGAYGGIWAENIVSGIARDILVEAMFRIEAAGYPIVMHVHDEFVCRSADRVRQRGGVPRTDDAQTVLGAGSADRSQRMARASLRQTRTSRRPARRPCRRSVS